MQTLNEIDQLVKLISKLPGLGPKSAKRIILKLISNRDSILKPMIKALKNADINISRCINCGSLKSEENCSNCNQIKKKYKKICIVENIADQWSIEASNIFEGYFHVLGGTINSSINSKETLLLNSLLQKIEKEKIEEVIIATSATVEGQTTAYYIRDSLKHLSVKISKLGQGLPVGGEIENLDDGTLHSAFKNRVGLDIESD
tara:strand:+ start:1618 stop:2226 length:609 start_codon:yes stop_codon:yes gene_type:complete